MPTRPQAVVFDLGKVLLDFDFQIAATALAPASRLGPLEFKRVLDQSPLLHQYESGRISSRGFFEEVVRLTGYSGSEPQFQAAFADIFSEIVPMLALHADLRARRVPTYIFSNTNEIAVTHIRERFPFFRDFDGQVFSYEVGVMKPHSRIYDAVEKMIGRRGAEILYLDDRAENIDAGSARGWQTILHHDGALTIAEVGRRFA